MEGKASGKIEEGIYFLWYFSSMRKKTSLLCLLVLVVAACKKDPKPEPPSSPPTETDILFLGHKGSGNTGYEAGWLENTLPSFQYAITRLDGVECDVQLSKDGTIWIWHNSDLNNDCDSNEFRSLITLTDAEIMQKHPCLFGYSDRIYKLKELLDFRAAAANSFTISIDVKSEFSSGSFAAVGGKSAYILREAQELGKLLQNISHPELMIIEFNDTNFVKEVKKLVSPDVQFHYVIEEQDLSSSIAKALTQGFDGISCTYNLPTLKKELLQYAQNQGLKVQLWTPYYLPDIEYCMSLNPDFIQTDRVEAKSDLNVN